MEKGGFFNSLTKKNYGKKGQKKKVVDSLSRKEWFELKAPAPFQSESFGFTCANRGGRNEYGNRDTRGPEDAGPERRALRDRAVRCRGKAAKL